MTTRAELSAKVAALFPQKSLANPTNSNLYALLTEILEAIGQPAQEAVTAVATTGAAIPADAEFVTVTSANAAHIVYLPDIDEVSEGKTIKIWVGANGFELSSGKVGDTINGVAASVGVKSAAIPATGLAICTAVDGGWLLVYLTELGAVATAIVPD